MTSIWPELKNCKISRTWTGLMPWVSVGNSLPKLTKSFLTPLKTLDGNPMIGPFVTDIHINTGLQSAGLMMGAGASKYCAELVAAELRGEVAKPDKFCDPTRFNLPGTQF